MTVLVVYATRYGATRGIAERIAKTLNQSGHDAQVARASEAGDVKGYDAFVIGSAAYKGGWLDEATRFVNTNLDLLTTRPVWLFSSGPLGTSPTDKQGRDLLVLTEPKQFDLFARSVLPRGRQVFFGALDPARLRFADRLLRRLPTGRGLLPEGDFRDWDAIEAWARTIATQLPAPAPAPHPTPAPGDG
jgi:menaquinone-dependent protoporphyrinogen oxidase